MRTEKQINGTTDKAEELLIICDYHAGFKTLEESRERLSEYVNQRIERELKNYTKAIRSIRNLTPKDSRNTLFKSIEGICNDVLRD